MDQDFILARFNYEHERRDKLSQDLTLPVGVLTVLAGGLIAMVRSFRYGEDRVVTIAFVAFALIALAAFVGAVWKLGLAWFGRKYAHLPLLCDLDATQKAFAAYAAELPTSDQTFDSRFRSELIRATDKNTATNDRRSSQLYKARVLVFVVLVFSGLSSVPYSIDQVKGMSNDSNPQSGSNVSQGTPVAPQSGSGEGAAPVQAAPTPATPATATPASPPSVPSFPAFRELREGGPTNRRDGGTPDKIK